VTERRFTAVTLTVGWVMAATTLSLHPSGRQLLTAAEPGPILRTMTAVHALGIASLPLLLLGGFGVTRWLGGSQPWPAAAFACFGLAQLAALNAAVAGGFLAPWVIRQMAADESEVRLWRLLFRYTVEVNQTFARVMVLGLSLALVLWSVSLAGRKGAGRALGLAGVPLGLVVSGALLIGRLPVNAHGVGMVVIAHLVWSIGVACLLWRDPPRGASRTAPLGA